MKSELDDRLNPRGLEYRQVAVDSRELNSIPNDLGKKLGFIDFQDCAKFISKVKV